MTHIRAEDWLRELQKAVHNEHLTKIQACEEVFAELETGDHDAETETLFYNFTRGVTC